jgi:tetratricopeptide (TPR) repeat protein
VLEPVLALLAGLACAAGPQFSTTWPCRYLKSVQDLATAPDDAHRLYVLPDAAKAAFELGKRDEARQYARELLRLAPEFRDNWNYGNAIHDGHMVLGRLALRDGNMETARAELLQAGRTPGSPQLNSFGPNVSLAKDLLEKKEVDAVVEYFALCARFWKLERGNLEQWSVLAKAGEMPDFGPNLVY